MTISAGLATATVPAIPVISVFVAGLALAKADVRSFVPFANDFMSGVAATRNSCPNWMPEFLRLLTAFSACFDGLSRRLRFSAVFPVEF